MLLWLLLLAVVALQVALFARGTDLFSETCCRRFGVRDQTRSRESWRRAVKEEQREREEGERREESVGRTWTYPEDLAEVFSGPQTVDESKFKLHIKVLTYNRIESLERCLNSLENADYGGDEVDLDVYVDHAFDVKRGVWSDKVSQRVGITHSILARLDAIVWSHGQRRLHYRSQNVGIQPQWLEAWWPESVNDFSLVVEDDMELSPLFYRYFRHLVSHYYYNVTNFDPQVYGISFQRQSFVPG